MDAIYLIRGGANQIQQDAQAGVPTKYIVTDRSNAPNPAFAYSNSRTGPIWTHNIIILQGWANQWAGKHVTLEQERQLELF
jgi:hypothetical protein